MAEKKKYPFYFYIIMFAIPAFFLYFIFGLSGGGESADPGKESCYICRQFVRKALKAPSGADFQTCNEAQAYFVSVSEGKSVYEVHSYVDAQNSFGAKLRNNYECKLQYDPSDKKGTLLDLKFTN